MGSPVHEALERALNAFIDYLLTGDSLRLDEFVRAVDEVPFDEVPDSDLCTARRVSVSPESKYCFIGQVMSYQYSLGFRTCGGCPFFFSKDFFDVIRSYKMSGDVSILLALVKGKYLFL